eukprot:jgi/Mesen1/8676/ME000051S08079
MPSPLLQMSRPRIHPVDKIHRDACARDLCSLGGGAVTPKSHAVAGGAWEESFLNSLVKGAGALLRDKLSTPPPAPALAVPAGSTKAGLQKSRKHSGAIEVRRQLEKLMQEKSALAQEKAALEREKSPASRSRLPAPRIVPG